MSQVIELVRRLNDEKKLRVWSVIITFFGDAILPRGGAVSAKTVQEVLECMGIEAGAVRTAFFRLTAEGWVVRTKLGRSSHYHLSDSGLHPFATATDEIYAPLPRANSGLNQWILTLTEGEYPDFQLSRPGELGICRDKFRMEGAISHIPEWMKQQKCKPQHARSYNKLLEAFHPVDPSGLSKIEAMAIRCLLIHEWRRILFQFEKVAPEFWTKDWPQSTCHTFVASLYHRLLPASETWVDKNATGPNGRLNSPREPLGARFN